MLRACSNSFRPFPPAAAGGASGTFVNISPVVSLVVELLACAESFRVLSLVVALLACESCEAAGSGCGANGLNGTAAGGYESSSGVAATRPGEVCWGTEGFA